MKFKLPYIPEDEDAKGIVVKVLSFEYYLKPFWLTFKDPYIEVEYQVSTRRLRLNQTVYLSILTFIFGIYISIYPYTLYISNNPDKSRYTIICNSTGSFIIITSIIQMIIIFKKSFNNVFNWPVLFIIKNSITFFVFYYLMMYDIFNIKYDPTISEIGNDIIKYLYIFDTEISHTITIIVITIYILTILTINILNIKQFIVAIFLHSFMGSFFLINYKSIYDTGFKNPYDIFGWRLALKIIPGLNANFNKDLYRMIINNSTNEELNEFIKISLNQEKIFKDAIKNNIYPYEVSIFNINKYYNSLLCTYTWLWIILVIFLFSVVYTREKGLRADFIVRRVYSDIDKPRNMDSGIEIKQLKNDNETSEDQEIIKNNLKKWKKDKDSNNTIEDKNINNIEVNIDLSEIESTIGYGEDLDEMGSILEGRTVKSFISNSTFKNDKDEIVNNIKKIIPKSYTKSEKSNNSVNDIESESHVQC